MRDTRDGRSSAYQTVAVQLRNLLADTSRSGPLLLRVIPQAKFHKLKEPDFPLGTIPEGAVMWEMNPRGSLTLGGGLPTIRLEVTDELIAIDEWLDDWIIVRTARIRDVIYEVASKDVAHTDSTRGTAMSAIEGNQELVAGGQRLEIVRPVLVGIGEYVAVRTRELLAH